MKRWLGIAVVLCVAAATPLVAQQASSPAPQAGASTALAGPRLTPEFRRAQPAFADSSASASTVAAGSHTVTVTTLVLVLVIIIAVLLIAN
jgi:hypothetical protein